MIWLEECYNKISNKEAKDRREVKMRKKGFTLMELVVVIAVLAVLGLLLYPSITNYLQVAQKRVCDDNMRQVSNALQFEYAFNKDVSPQDILDNKNNEYFDKAVKCPSGGQYVIFSSGKYHAVICSKHRADSELSSLALETYYGMIADYNTLSDSEFMAKYGIKKVAFRNDTFLDEFRKKFDGTTWPKLTDDISKFLEGFTLNNKFDPSQLNQIPYSTFGKDSSGNWAGGTYIFAGGGSGNVSDTGGWGAYMVYSPYTNTWYRSTKKNPYNGALDSNSMTGKEKYTLDEMEAWLASSEWEAVR